MIHGANAINNFPLDTGKAGIVIYNNAYFRENVAIALCTRNLESAISRLTKFNARILYKFNVNSRDIEGKRIFRILKNSLQIISANETSLAFYMNNTITTFFNKLSQNKNIVDPKTTIQRLKAYVRATIKEKCGIAKITTVEEIIKTTFPLVDGLSIEQFLIWLANDDFISITKNPYNYFKTRIKLL